RRVRTTAGLDADDAILGQCLMARQETRVLSCVDVIGHHGDVVMPAQGTTEAAQECGLAGTHGAADTNAQALLACRSAGYRCIHDHVLATPQERNRREYWLSCLQLAMARPGRQAPGSASSF